MPRAPRCSIRIARAAGRTRPPPAPYVFIAFSGEELGLLGSAHYVKEPIYPLSGTLAMINLDMVGRLRDNRLIVYGVRTAKEFPALLDSLNWHAGFDLKAQGDGYGPSDQSSFFAAGKPVLHVFTDLHEDYHRTTDDWEKISLDGFDRVASFTLGIVTALANRPTRLTPVRRSASTAAAGGVLIRHPGIRRLSRHDPRHDRQSRRRAAGGRARGQPGRESRPAG